jgi:hypothetical protein
MKTCERCLSRGSLSEQLHGNSSFLGRRWANLSRQRSILRCTIPNEEQEGVCLTYTRATFCSVGTEMTNPYSHHFSQSCHFLVQASRLTYFEDEPSSAPSRPGRRGTGCPNLPPALVWRSRSRARSLCRPGRALNASEPAEMSDQAQHFHLPCGHFLIYGIMLMGCAAMTGDMQTWTYRT